MASYLKLGLDASQRLLSSVARVSSNRLYLELPTPSTPWSVATLERAMRWCYVCTSNANAELDVRVIPAAGTDPNYVPVRDLEDIDVVLDTSDITAAALAQVNQEREARGLRVVRPSRVRRGSGSGSDELVSRFVMGAEDLHAVVSGHDVDSPTIPSEQRQWMPNRFRNAVVGGTFDRLHVGHKVLLGVTAMLASDYVEIGVTDDIMLQSKKYKEFIQPMGERMSVVTSFMRAMKPSLRLNVFPLQDAYGYTITNESLEVLALTQENYSAIVGVNAKRAEIGNPPMSAYVIALIAEEDGNPDNKVSSTGIRERAAARAAATGGGAAAAPQ